MKPLNSKLPRRNAKLQMLPEQRQAEIVEYARTHSVAATSRWLLTQGISIHASQVSRFITWYRIGERLRSAESIVGQTLAALKKEGALKTQRELQGAGQAFFTALAIEQEDSMAWKRLQDISIKQESLRIDREKFMFDAVAACRKQLPKLQEIEADEEMTEEEKDAVMRKILFPE